MKVQQKTRSPLVSVIMGVHNGEPYLGRSIRSILNQSFTDFEFLIIDDASTDGSIETINSFNDSRICLIRNDRNRGLSFSLNRGIKMARGEYIIRMDSDDISHTERLAQQVSFMDSNPNVAVTGTWARIFGARRGTMRKPAGDDEMRAMLVFESPFVHPSVIIRKNVLDRHGLLYDESVSAAQDYHFWVTIPPQYRLANIDRVLLYYRTHRYQVTTARKAEQIGAANVARKRQLEKLGLHPTEEELSLHSQICTRRDGSSEEFVSAAERWLKKLGAANSECRTFAEEPFRRVLGHYWWEACFHATGLGLHAWEHFLSSSLRRHARISKKYMILFLIKCVMRYRKIVSSNQ